MKPHIKKRMDFIEQIEEYEIEEYEIEEEYEEYGYYEGGEFFADEDADDNINDDPRPMELRKRKEFVLFDVYEDEDIENL